MQLFTNLPAPMKVTAGAAGGGALVVMGVAIGTGRWTLLVFLLVSMALLALLMGIRLLWAYLKRRRQSAQLGKELGQSTTAGPRGMSATDLAKMDNLRKKFQEGVDAFRSRGKDLYALPWYAIVGEPGSGKTEAVRHCNVGFPPGMHEGENSTGYMGAGGTINMNWWFTNQAVLLDTAGRLMFEEVKPGETSEWKEFLKLLKKNRPYCPINGLLLVIPSDSLIKDSADQIASKAGKIAQQLDVIQRVLDYRFPVYVVISKSDKINGFREFFEGLTDPQLQHQMLGWSNPDPLDSAFKPEQVDQYLSQVSERLRRRRLGLMRDPVPETAPRRTDEVDSLYALPSSLLMLAPRMRRYLETIFMPGEWSAKPLFLRGIYFTSSMREGAALDQELAEAIGVTADELPEGKMWERDRAYFLRDLFMDKVFKEKGLVTRATNIKQRLRRNQVIIYGCVVAALLMFIAVAWLGMRNVRKNVKDSSDYWSAAAGVGWEGRSWSRAVLRLEDEGGYSLVTNRLPNTLKLSPGEFHQKLRELAEKEIKGSWTVPGLAGSYNEISKRAQRVVFETGVLSPLMEAVNKRMKDITPDTLYPYQAEALAALLRLESDILNRAKGEDVAMDSRTATNLLGTMLSFATGQEVTFDTALDSNVVSTLVWTYAGNKAGQKAWPPAWLSATTTNANNVATNAVLYAGLDYFIRRATNTIYEVGTNWVQATNLAAALRAYEKAENALLLGSLPDQEKVMSSFRAMKTERERLQAQIAVAAKNDLFKGGVTLAGAYQSFTNQIMAQALGAFDRVEKELRDARKKHAEYPVFLMVAKRLETERSGFSSGMANLVSSAEAEEFKRLDERFLALQGNDRVLEQRWRLYERGAGLLDTAQFAGAPRKALVEKLAKALSDRGDLEKALPTYTGYANKEVAALGRFFVDGVAVTVGDAFGVAYGQQAEKDLGAGLGFPLLKRSTKVLTSEQLDATDALLQAVSDEMTSAGTQLPRLKDGANWKALAGRVALLKRLAGVLKVREGKPDYCTISLLKMEDQTKADDAWRAKFRYIKLDHAGGGTRMERTNVGEDQELGKVSLRKACQFQLYQRDDDKEPGAVVREPGEWAPLALLLKSESKPAQEGDFTTWIVKRPAEGAGAGALRLRLKFDEPLVDLEQWP